MTIPEMQQERAALIEKARAIHNTAGEEQREMSAEDTANFDAAWVDIGKLEVKIAREKKLEDAERTLTEPEARISDPEPTDAQRAREENEEQRVGLDSDEYRDFFNSCLRVERRPNDMPDEFRALQSDVDIQAGYLTIPQEMASGILGVVDNLFLIRGLSKNFQVPQAASLGLRKRTARMATFAWSSELKVSTEDSTLAFGKKVLEPHHLTGQIKVSRDLMRRVPDVQGIVRDELAYDAGETMEEAYFTGTGAQQPLGVMTASADGISTGRDVSTGNTNTTIGADNLRECLYTLLPQYRRNAQWIFHRDGIKMISKLKDGNGQYLWTPGIRAEDPDILLGRPAHESEYQSNTFTSGLYVGILGDFSHYVTADALDMEIQVLYELDAATNQIRFIGRMKSDGLPVLEEGFVRVTLT